MDNGLNVNAVHFAIQLVKYVSDDKHAPHVSEVGQQIAFDCL